MVDAAQATNGPPNGPGVAANRLGWLGQLRWQVFRQLERIANRSLVASALPSAPVRKALWVFVSTIGELNAIAPFLQQLVAQTSDLQLVLITDRNIYRAAYLAQYPQAEIVEINADSDAAFALMNVRPPRLFVVAEIPCLPADAPCRLPIGYLHAARASAAHVALVNGWLYGYAPSCRMDAIERSWLARDYLQMFDLLCVQNDAVAQALIAAGAEPSRVHVTGNIKFDALDPQPRSLEQTRSPRLLASLAQSQRPVIVAGCVTDDEERDLVLDAFVLLRASHPDAALVLAPRHPEQAAVMRNLGQALQDRRLGSRLRSAGPDEPMHFNEDILVLDTMGELRDFYATADVAHVGRDHNLLEPLAYRKPVTARPDWHPGYPSYPVFALLMQRGALVTTAQSNELAQLWLGVIDGKASGHAAVIEQERGASERTLTQYKKILAGR